MPADDLNEVLSVLPQAAARVDGQLRVLWIDPAFATKTGIVLEEGQSVLDVLERGAGRDALERSVVAGIERVCEVTTCALKQARVRVQPTAESTGAAWLVFESAGLDDEVAFAQALQEIARALGETLDVDS